MQNRLKPKVLYITYLGLLEPISRSQIIPYLLELSKDVQVYILSFEKRKILANKQNEQEQIRDKLIQSGIIWHQLMYHKYPLVLSSFFDIFIGIFFSLCVIIRHKIQIIHARSNIPVAIGWIIKLFMPVKLLYDRRGIMADEYIENSGWRKGGYLYRIAVWFEKCVIRKSDAVVVLTDRMNGRLRNNADFNKGVLIKTIPCCVDLELFKHIDSQEVKDKLGLAEKFVFVYSGSLGTYNLVDEMLDFFKIVLEHISNAHFLILTHTPEPAIQAYNKKGIDPKRITLTFASREELPRFLSLADFAMIFRQPTVTAQAASPTKFAEYLACGIPVVCGPGIGDLEEIIKQRNIGIIFNNYNKSEYEIVLQRLATLKQGRKDLGKRCRATAKQLFSLEGGASTYLHIYRELVK